MPPTCWQQMPIPSLSSAPVAMSRIYRRRYFHMEGQLLTRRLVECPSRASFMLACMFWHSAVDFLEYAFKASLPPLKWGARRPAGNVIDSGQRHTLRLEEEWIQYSLKCYSLQTYSAFSRPCATSVAIEPRVHRFAFRLVVWTWQAAIEARIGDIVRCFKHHL